MVDWIRFSCSSRRLDARQRRFADGIQAYGHVVSGAAQERSRKRARQARHCGRRWTSAGKRRALIRSCSLPPPLLLLLLLLVLLLLLLLPVIGLRLLLNARPAVRSVLADTVVVNAPAPS